MKLSLILAALILIAASFFGWKEHGRLSSAHTENSRLVGEAQELGLDTADLAAGGDKSTQTKIRRDPQVGKAAQAKDFATRLIAFAREMEETQKKGGQPDDAMQKRIVGIMEEMLSLDPAQLKLLVAEFRAAPDLTDDMRSGMIGFAVMMLANDHPATALNLLAESSDLMKNDGMAMHVVTSALTKWAQDDPKAAIEWIRKNGKDHPEMVNAETKQGILTGAARLDPVLAFSLAADLDLKDLNSLGQAIGQAGNTSEERIAIVGALRNHLKGLEGEQRKQMLNSTMGALVNKVVAEGYASSAAWLDSAKLDEAETTAFADGINSWYVKGDTGKWLEWMDGKLPPERLDAKVQSLMGEWAQKDYKAAGQWIDDAKDGPVKNAAVRSYAGTVAPYDPGSAAEWALTLPEGKERTELMGNIHTQWKQKDAEAAAKFARDNGLPE
ncbi:hypothetical protein [Luteolibacter sp. Populi]|uniref:hypothetical protein n=1 Tax=Luteolibacter sp. Populi TaxID=3230487 RepID=UPI003465758F